MKKIYMLLSVYLIIGYSTLKGQALFPTFPNAPASIKWEQINTDHFKVIFPKGFEVQGQRMANTLEHLYKPVSKSLNVIPRKTPIILQNQHAVSNGNVSLGPRRSEFYTMSPQDYNFIGNNDWLEMLAVHELRHISQYEKSRTGHSKIAYNLFGENAQSLLASSIPLWLYEGDAVGIETALTQSGRGRFPSFSKAFQANLLEKGSFNYSKQYLNSFKDYIPNYYVLGYYFSTFLKNNYGTDAVGNILKKTWDKPFIPFRYSFSMKKITGKKMPALYQEMMSELKNKWQQQQINTKKITAFKNITKRKSNVYTNYKYPQVIDSSASILALKSGLGYIDQLVSIDLKTGKETKKVKIKLGTLNNPGFLSLTGNTVVWAEYRSNPRWTLKSYSIIKTYNLTTKETKKITHKTRYSAPSISPDESKIVVVENTEDYANKLVILEANSGNIIKKITPKTTGFFSMPSWDDTGKSIVVLHQKNQKKSIVQINIENENEKILIPYSKEHIGHPVLVKEFLFYNAAISGVDNIYATNLKTNQKYQVTSSKYGASNPAISVDGRSIYYNDYTVNGENIVEIPFNPNNWRPLSEVKNNGIDFHKLMVEEENNSEILLSVPDSTYQLKKYRKNIPRIHSWTLFIPSFSDASYSEPLAPRLVELGVGLYFKNLLSSTSLFLGVTPNFSKGKVTSIRTIAKISYQGLYPIIDLIIDDGKKKSNYLFLDPTEWWEGTNLKAGLRIPWQLASSRFQSKIEVYNYIGLFSLRNISIQNPNIITDTLPMPSKSLYNEFSFSIYNLHNQSKRDINSKFGQILTFKNYSTPYGGTLSGQLTAIKARLYFPGIIKHHSFNFLLGYEHKTSSYNNDNYFFYSRVPFPRGYALTHVPIPNFFTSFFEAFYTVQSNYEFPLLYPDIKIGGLLYLQRIRANLFYDYALGISEFAFFGGERFNLSTVGIELSIDYNIMRLLSRLGITFRVAYLPATGIIRPEISFGAFSFNKIKN